MFYKEPAILGDVSAPYYGTVCSAFATLCDGWPYPQTNAGFVYDPMVTLGWSAVPPLGVVYSDITSHCAIPERIDHMSGVDAVSMQESVRPVSGRTTRYSNITPDTDEGKFNASYLDGYFDDYGYTAHHILATDMSNAPYADFDDVEIVPGSALPYHGDRCVHTSDDDAVLINIKRDDATAIVLTGPDGFEQTIQFVAGAAQVDVKPYIAQDGIYYIRTDVDSVRASFEYRTVTSVAYTIKDGVISFDDNDFWYAAVDVEELDDPGNGRVCCMPASQSNDYSDWSRDGHRVTGSYRVFHEGAYGAYVARCSLRNQDDTPEDNPLTIVIDATLTREGQAADAKATGEAINRLSEEKGAKQQLIAYTKVAEDETAVIVIDKDKDGQPFNLEKAIVRYSAPTTTREQKGTNVGVVNKPDGSLATDRVATINYGMPPNGTRICQAYGEINAEDANNVFGVIGASYEKNSALQYMYSDTGNGEGLKHLEFRPTSAGNCFSVGTEIYIYGVRK